MARLRAKRDGLSKALERAGNRSLIVGIQSVQALCPVRTSNLKNSYPRCSYVLIEGLGVLIIWESDVYYQIYQELLYRPHLRPGIHMVLDEIHNIFVEEINAAAAEGDS